MSEEKKLSAEQKELALEHVLELRPLELLHKKLGFKTRLQFHRYCQSDPEFNLQMEETKKAACKYLEDDLLFVCDEHDPKQARTKLEAISKLLVFLNPSKYSQKIDLNLNQTISIRIALDGSNDRIAGLLRDVTPRLSPHETEKKPC